MFLIIVLFRELVVRVPVLLINHGVTSISNGVFFHVQHNTASLLPVSMSNQPVWYQHAMNVISQNRPGQSQPPVYEVTLCIGTKHDQSSAVAQSPISRKPSAK